MSSTVSGQLSNMSTWVTFEDIDGRTRIARRMECQPCDYELRAVVVDGRVIFTKLTFEEIFGAA